MLRSEITLISLQTKKQSGLPIQYEEQHRTGSDNARRANTLAVTNATETEGKCRKELSSTSNPGGWFSDLILRVSLFCSFGYVLSRLLHFFRFIFSFLVTVPFVTGLKLFRMLSLSAQAGPFQPLKFFPARLFGNIPGVYIWERSRFSGSSQSEISNTSVVAGWLCDVAMCNWPKDWEA